MFPNTAESLDYSFLLVVHMVCADQQIHNKELKYLALLEKQREIKQDTLEEKEKIITKNENCLSLNYVADKVPSSEQMKVMEQMLIMAGIDVFFAPSELETVKQVAEIWYWNLDDRESEKLKKQAEKSVSEFFEYQNNNNNNRQKVSRGSNVYKAVSSVVPGFFKGRVDRETESNFVTKGIVKKWENELFQEEYQNALSYCQKIANEDFKYTEKALRKTESELENIQKYLDNVLTKTQEQNKQNQGNTAQDVANQFKETKELLDTKIIKLIKSVQESLDSKQRSLQNFTISFIGKTKSGKSTLHAIMTEKGWDKIGKGKQRTTRYNRVYEWEGIRIIDTPGIGAPEEGGRTDE